jgi:hypothetical protein
VVRQWTALVAEQYYRIVAVAVREADPDALIFGDRLPIYYDPDAVRAMVPYVDVISVNYNVDAPNGWVASYFFAALRRLTGDKPLPGPIGSCFLSAGYRTGGREALPAAPKIFTPGIVMRRSSAEVKGATFAFLVVPGKRDALRALITLCYFWAGTLKLNWEWVSGAGLYRPMWPFIGAGVVAACAYVIVLELVVSWGLLARRAWIFWAAARPAASGARRDRLLPYPLDVVHRG